MKPVYPQVLSWHKSYLHISLTLWSGTLNAPREIYSCWKKTQKLWDTKGQELLRLAGTESILMWVAQSPFRKKQQDERSLSGQPQSACDFHHRTHNFCGFCLIIKIWGVSHLLSHLYLLAVPYFLFQKWKAGRKVGNGLQVVLFRHELL